ncbi:hypothetical protein Misp06_03054 [Microbulbifer sp. NBRC 101763]|uniref:hypothetical protein n=1 Tax=Microbulbifer sp. NBRC 101763 TaxID=1113820 RepID=UPI00309DEA71
MFKYLTVAAIALFSQVTFADNTIAKVDSFLLVDSTKLVYVYPEGGVKNPPACHGSNGDYISFSMDRPMAKEYLSAIMYAHATGKTVNFRTHGACVDQSISDTLNYLSVLKD